MDPTVEAKIKTAPHEPGAYIFKDEDGKPVDGFLVLPGVEVQFTDAARGRIVVTQESDTTDEQEAGLRRIQALPGLFAAELVCHYFGDLEEDAEGV